VTEVRFYHCERRRPGEALPALLEQALAEGQRVVVQTSSPEAVEALDERLWTYADDSFLPHGSARDGEPERQPAFLTDGPDNPNGAKLRILVEGAQAAPILADGASAHEQLIVLFDGRDDEARAGARAQWSELKSAGASVSYWRENDDGVWEKAG